MKSGDWIVHSHFGLGCVTELLKPEDDLNVAKVAFVSAGEKLLALQYARIRPATDFEIACKHLKPDFSEPLTHALSLLDQVETAISSWTWEVDSICKIWSSKEDYRDSLTDREEVDWYLAACRDAGVELTAELASQLAAADRKFTEATAESDESVWDDEKDKTRFWYYFRWPPNKLPLSGRLSFAPEEATLEAIESDIQTWEKSIEYVAQGFDCTEELTHDVFQREILDAMLEAYDRDGKTLPDSLKARIEAADRRFMGVTREIETDIWGGPEHYDKSLYWYYYRFPLK